MLVLRTALFLVLLNALFSCTAPREPQDPGGTTNTDSLSAEFKEDFDFLYREIRDNYVNLAYVERRYGFLWDELYEEYAQKAGEAKTYKDFYNLCTQFTAHLRDGHLRFRWIPRNPEDRLLTDTYPIRRALSFRLIEDTVIISEAVDDEVLGKEVLSINGISIGTILDRMQGHHYWATDDYQAKARLLYRNAYLEYFDLYFDAFPEHLVLEIRDKQGDLELYSLETQQWLGGPGKKLWRPLLGEDRSQLPQGSIIDGSYGYIKIPTFSGKAGEIRETFKALIQNFKGRKIEKIIIDVRGNGGGNESFREVLGFLTPRSILVNRYRFKKTDRFDELFGIGRILFEYLRSPSFNEHLEEGYTRWWSWVVKPQKENYLTDLQVAVIYDDLIFSSTIDFVYTCSQFHLATIIGPSMNVSGNGLTKPVMLPGKHFTLEYAMMEFRNPDYSYYEALIPDMEARATLDDLRAGKDTVLDTALRYLEEAKNPETFTSLRLLQKQPAFARASSLIAAL